MCVYLHACVFICASVLQLYFVFKIVSQKSASYQKCVNEFSKNLLHVLLVVVVVQGIRQHYLSKVLTFVAKQLEESSHLQFYLTFAKHLLTSHGPHIKKSSTSLMPVLRMLQKSLSRHSGAMASM